MSIRLFCGVMVVVLNILSAVTRSAHAQDMPYGTYTCVAQRVVGIQGDRQSGNRFHGRVTLKPEQERFLITIKPVREHELCKGKTSEDPYYRAAGAYHFWWECKAKNEVTFSEGKSISPMRADDLYIFRDDIRGLFNIGSGGPYLSYYEDRGGNSWLEEGVCQKP